MIRFLNIRILVSIALVVMCAACSNVTYAQAGPILNNPSNVDEGEGSFSQHFPTPSASIPAYSNETLPAVDHADEGVEHGNETPTDDVISGLVSKGVSSVSSREGTAATVKAAVIFGALSLAPAILLMTTCYIRIVVVLGLLRQAFGAQQLPPTQVLTALTLFITILVMAPVWNQVKTDAIDPYTAEGSEMTWDEAWAAGVRPVKDFMSRQIERAGNKEAIAIFYKYAPAGVSPGQEVTKPNSYAEVPLNVVLPAFVLSELKVAFLLGFQIYLPFLVLDLVVSSVTVSMGMLMLPPTMVSFPLKLILFVMVDGWNLVVGMLLQSFGPFG